MTRFILNYKTGLWHVHFSVWVGWNGDSTFNPSVEMYGHSIMDAEDEFLFALNSFSFT